MSSTTLEPPHSGPENHGALLLGIIWTEASIGAIVVLARFYARIFCKKMLGWDDLWMAITWVCALTTNILDTVGIHYGIGQHLFYLTPDQRMQAVKLDWISHATAITATGLGKVAFACTLLRIVAVRWQRIFLHSYIWLLIAVNVPLIFMTYLQCNPVDALWDPNVHAHCWNPHTQAGYAVFQGAYGVLADFVLALFPLVFISGLQVSSRIKVGLASLMCLGVFAGACAIMKTYYLPRMTARADFTWETQFMIIWFTTEMYAIMIAASVPALPPIFGKRKNSRSGNSSAYTQATDGFDKGSKNRWSKRCYSLTDHEATDFDRSWGATARSTAKHDRTYSEEEMLTTVGSNGIMQKTDIIVTHDEALPKNSADWARAPSSPRPASS